MIKHKLHTEMIQGFCMTQATEKLNVKLKELEKISGFELVSAVLVPIPKLEEGYSSDLYIRCNDWMMNIAYKYKEY